MGILTMTKTKTAVVAFSVLESLTKSLPLTAYRGLQTRPYHPMPKAIKKRLIDASEAAHWQNIFCYCSTGLREIYNGGSFFSTWIACTVSGKKRMYCVIFFIAASCGIQVGPLRPCFLQAVLLLWLLPAT